jgi:hypothetical protein
MDTVICVGLLTVKLLTVTPAPKLTAVAPVRLAPVMVTVTAWPCAAVVGLTEVMVGAGAGTVTVKRLLPVPVPPPVVIAIFLVPGAAPAAMVTEAVICVAPFTVKLLTVMPAPKSTTVAPVKLAPVITTDAMVWPCCPLLGLDPVTVGAGMALTVSVPESVAGSAPDVALAWVEPAMCPVKTALFMSPPGTRSPSATPPVLFCRDQAVAASLATKLSPASRVMQYIVMELPMPTP